MIARRRVTPSGPRAVVAFSIYCERVALLERGLGLEHLKELVTRLARPIVNAGASIAYAGGWQLTEEDSFTNLFLRLISAEQDDTSDDANTNPDAADRKIEPLINHLAWPRYLAITPRIEAEWINACRVVRVTQADAGITDTCPDDERTSGCDRAILSIALAMSKMRQLQTTGMHREVVPPGVQTEVLPRLAARILIGGRVCTSAGFLPGIYEEALLALEAGVPVYVLGGFGGAAEDVAALLLGNARADAFDAAALERAQPDLARLNALASAKAVPGARTTAALLHALDLWRGRASAPGAGAALMTGLGDDELRELMLTSDIDDAVKLVLRGLRATNTVQS